MAENILNVQLIDQRVTKLAEDLKTRLCNEVKVRNEAHRLKSVAFVYLVARSLLDLDPDQAMDGIVEGGGDLGVDAVYHTQPSGGEFTVTLIQGKYKKELEGVAAFPEDGIIKMINAIRIIFNPQVQYEANPRMTARIEAVRAQIAEGYYPQVRVILCNNGSRWKETAEQHMQGSGFGNIVCWEHVGPDALTGLMRARKPVDAKLQLSGKALVEDHPYMRAMIGRVSVMELARLFDENGDILLERNIRRHLGFSGRVNRGIADTLRDAQQRAKFYFYNNGVTIICNKFTHNPYADKDWVVNVDGLQIVNGGQTSKTVQHMLRELGPEIADATVLVRLYELPVDNEDLVQRITYATNSQNPVELRDLRSNDPRQKRLGEMIEELGYKYRRQRSSEEMAEDEMSMPQVAAAVLAVWRHRPHLVRQGSIDLTETLYEQIFTEDLNGAQAVIAVLLSRFARRLAAEGESANSDFPASGSEFAAMMMGQQILGELGVGQAGLNHRTFVRAQSVFESRGGDLYQRAVGGIIQAVKSNSEKQIKTMKKSEKGGLKVIQFEVVNKIMLKSHLSFYLDAGIVRDLIGESLSIDLSPADDQGAPS